MVAVVVAVGDLDDAAAVRLLRWCEARLHRLDVDNRDGQLLVDVSHAHQATVSALDILDHARIAAEHRRIGIHLVGAGILMVHGSLPARQRLGRWSRFPTVEAARAALSGEPTSGAAGSAARAVDPDAMLIPPTIHDRL